MAKPEHPGTHVGERRFVDGTSWYWTGTEWIDPPEHPSLGDTYDTGAESWYWTGTRWVDSSVVLSGSTDLIRMQEPDTP